LICRNHMYFSFLDEVLLILFVFIASEREICLIRPETTDFNFMPFRLRYRSICLSSSSNDNTINMTSCVNFKRVDAFMEMYDDHQAFYFYPLIPKSQKIYQYTLHPQEQRRCLTVSLPSQFRGAIDMPSSTIADMSFGVYMTECSVTDDHEDVSIQKFTFHIISNPRIDRYSVNIESKSNLKPITQVQIQWHWRHPSTKLLYSYCMSFPSTNETTTISNKLQLTPCNINKLRSDFTVRRDSNDSSLLQSIILERTRVISPPFRPGLVVGKYPTWSDP
jgi:hypothetical protein